MDKRVALRRLESSLRDYCWATDTPMPDVGVLLINLSRDGIDLQYIGIEPNHVVDWPILFAGIIQQLQDGGYSINNAAEIKFKS